MITPSELPPDASEAERLRAAQAAIALLRAHRKGRISAVPAQPAAPESVQVAAPASAHSTPRAAQPPVTATTPVELPHSIEAVASIRPASTPEATATNRRASGLFGLGIAAVFVIGGFIVGRITVPTVSMPAVDANEDQAQQAAQQLLKDNQRLANQVAELQVETTTLQEELLALELRALVSSSSEHSVISTLPGTRNEASIELSEVAASSKVSEQDSLIKAPPPDNANIDADALDTVGIDPEALSLVLSAFNRSLEALADIDASYENGTSNHADREQSRRQVREQLVEDIGLQAFLAGQHALGEPNRLMVTDVAPVGFEVPIESGDVLLSINGQRVVDLEQLRWVENDILDEADDAGVSGNNHVLEVLRNGERLAIAYDLPLEILLLDQDSVNPSLLD